MVIEDEEDKPLTTGSVTLMPEHWDGTGSGLLYGYQPRNGAYVIDNIHPGKYGISFTNAPGCYLKSVQSGTQTLDPQSIAIEDGASLDLLMIYSKNVASVTGDIETPPDQPAHSAHVLLLCEDSTPECDMASADLDQSLHFSNDHIRPGKYLAFAAQDNDSDLWKNADFIKLIQSEAVEIDLHEKEHATIHLKLIPKSETDRLRHQLGI
ncbi:MAG: hypothetical protein WAM39_26930 [Bryobacteraceae bacterium]